MTEFYVNRLIGNYFSPILEDKRKFTPGYYKKMALKDLKLVQRLYEYDSVKQIIPLIELTDFSRKSEVKELEIMCRQCCFPKNKVDLL